METAQAELAGVQDELDFYTFKGDEIDQESEAEAFAQN
jgi:hypothetical protein